MRRILVVGGAGFIGSHVNKMLHRAGYETVVFDNLSRGSREAVRFGQFVEGDTGSERDLDALFTTYHFDAVMHFAAFIDVGESVRHALLYYRNNVTNTLKLLEAMQRHGVKCFIFSSTAAVFGTPVEERISEAHPMNPINPYGMGKLMVERILADSAQASGLRFCVLRYFNAAGADAEGEIPIKKRQETNLIPIVLSRVHKGQGEPITIYGIDYPTADGTCVRDYIHVEDLARAHILAMEQLFEGASTLHYNLGNGNGFSVRQVLEAVRKVTGCSFPIVEGPRRPGDPPQLIADASKAMRELGWSPQIPVLETIVAHAWQAIRSSI